MYLFNSLFAFLAALATDAVVILHILAGLISPQITYVAPPSPIPTQIATTSQAIQTSTSTKPQAQKPSVPKTLPPDVSAAIPPASPAATPAPTATQIEQINEQTRASLVNILCTTEAGGYFEPISGSGIIIDSRGIILTNAHVGQFFLLRNYLVPGNINCVIRTGSPAQAMYTAELVYLPPAWITANASQILSQHATGTGENDYSFLLITGTTNPNDTLPASFPALPMSAAEPDTGQQVLIAGYPAGLLDGTTIEMNLYSSSAVTQIIQLYSFDSTQHVDLVSLAPSVVSQSGSSGGAVVNLANDNLVGLISTESSGTTTADRDLYAITLAHINRSLATEGKGGIVSLLQQDPTQEAQDFATNVAPAEIAQLTAVLSKQN